MFEPRVDPPTDEDLLTLLATRAMGWKLHNTSGHRPGRRDIPHAWIWRHDRVRFMVFVGGSGPQANVEFDPLENQASAEEMIKRLRANAIDVSGWDISTPAGRRSTCEAAAEKLKAIDSAKPTVEPAEKPDFVKHS